MLGKGGQEERRPSQGALPGKVTSLSKKKEVLNMARKKRKITDAQLVRIRAIRFRKNKKKWDAKAYGAGLDKPIHRAYRGKRKEEAGTFGPAGPCRRINPETGEYLD